MSKPVKEMILRDYQARFGSAEAAMIIGVRGLSGQKTTALRSSLAKKNVRVSVVRNALARRMFTGSPLEPLNKLLTGSSAVAYGGESVVEVARNIVDLIKDFPEVELKGAVLDGTLFEGKKGVEELSKYPTRDEAIGQVVTLIVSPARKLVANILGPGATVAGIVKAIETKLEKGEAIARKAG